MDELRTVQKVDRTVSGINMLSDDPNRSRNRLFIGSNPWYRHYVVSRSVLVDTAGVNRFRYFHRKCALCGKPISGRPAEYPYYRIFDQKVAYLCDICDELKNITLKA